MTTAVRYVTYTSLAAAGAAGANNQFTTTGNDYILVNLEVVFPQVINANTPIPISYTYTNPTLPAPGVIKNLISWNVTTAAGADRKSAPNQDTCVVNAAGTIITYTPVTNNTLAGSSLNLLLAIGSY